MNEEPNTTEQVHIWVKGRVQGVGFRAFVERNARRLGLTGWVRNVGDETVEAVAEGARDKLEHFVRMMQHGPRMSQVDESTVEWETAAGGTRGFEVRPSQ